MKTYTYAGKQHISRMPESNFSKRIRCFVCVMCVWPKMRVGRHNHHLLCVQSRPRARRRHAAYKENVDLNSAEARQIECPNKLLCGVGSFRIYEYIYSFGYLVSLSDAIIQRIFVESNKRCLGCIHDTHTHTSQVMMRLRER